MIYNNQQFNSFACYLVLFGKELGLGLLDEEQSY